MKERPDVIGRTNFKIVYIKDCFSSSLLDLYYIFPFNVFKFEHATIFRVRHVGMYPILHPAQKVVEAESRNEASIVFKKFVMA